MVSDDDDGLMSNMFTHLSGSLLASCSNDQVLPVVCVCVCVCVCVLPCVFSRPSECG